jgi:hypothetical protein
MPDPKYIVRVSGLGPVVAMMLDSAHTDETARRDIEIIQSRDPRMRVEALYRVKCLLDELGDDKEYPRLQVVSGRVDGTSYLLTATEGKHFRQTFFSIHGPQAALAHVRERSWTKARLYQLEGIPL